MEKHLIYYLHDLGKKNNKIGANFHNSTDIDQLEQVIETSKDKITLTFDDGYRSILKVVPLLEKYSINCLIFITTGFIDRNVYPYEVEISNYLENKSSINTVNNKKYHFKNNQEKNVFLKSIQKKLMAKSFKIRENYLNKLAEKNNYDRKNYQKDFFLNWDEIRNLHKHPLIKIGSHTVSHLFLPSQDIFTVFTELKVSKQRLEEELGESIPLLSYPYGGNNLITQQAAKYLSYKKAYATGKKALFKNNLNINRIDFNKIDFQKKACPQTSC